MSVTILLLALLLTIVTVVIHSLGAHVTLIYSARFLQGQRSLPLLRTVALAAFLVTFLLMIHVVEAGVWALVYYSWRMLPDFSTSAYYSMTSYSTVGFGDVVLPASTRLLGPIESVVGVLMLGWSTAVIVTVVQKIYRVIAHSFPEIRRAEQDEFAANGDKQDG